MELRSMFQSIFGNAKEPQHVERFEMLNTFTDCFYEGNTSVMAEPTVRSILDCIGRHASKLKPVHIVRDGENRTEPATGKQLDYNFLLAYRPNEYMSTSDFLYKVMTKAYMFGNCFIQIKRNEQGDVKGLYPLDFSEMELKEVEGNLFCKFYFSNGKRVTVLYSDIVHIRKNYCANEILGDMPNNILSKELHLLATCKSSLENEIKNATAMRGYLKYKVQVKQKDKDAEVQHFNELARKNGVSVLDGDADYIDIAPKAISTSGEQLHFLRENVYRFFGVSEAILDGKYKEDEWQAFFESIIEPFALQLGLELTCKIFTPRQIGFGNRIVVDENRLQYASLAHKADMAYKLLPQGILTIDEAREMLNLAPCADPELGSKHFMTLNNQAVKPLEGGEGDGQGEED